MIFLKKSNQFSELQLRQALLMAESSLGNDDEAALHRGTSGDGRHRIPQKDPFLGTSLI